MNVLSPFIIIIIIIIIHEFQSDASPEELQGRCNVTVFSLWLWPVLVRTGYLCPLCHSD